MKAAEWIDRLKAERGWNSDYRVAQELDVAHSTLSRYRTKPGATLDDDIAVKVASALDVEPEIILLDQVTERTPSPTARTALSGLLARLVGNAPGGSGAAGKGRLDITSAASSAPEGGDPVSPTRNTHRVKQHPSSVVRLVQAIGKWLTPPPCAPLAGA